ncbi:MAG: hypothetical protein K8S15_02910 [Candidatus Aegiribacteria sp.]|nr:hypothetical protein [Candidatus Aegiribacteria sp.]
MKKVKWFIPLITTAAVVLLISCGNNENPATSGDNPTASILSANSGTTNSITASWTMCPDNDFSEYNLYRSASPGISGNPPASPVRTVSNSSDTTFTDTRLAWGETYYYSLNTRNTSNNTVWSNEVEVVTPCSDYLTCYEIQGQQTSSPYVGHEVSVTGIVTTGGNVLYGRFAVICDATGGPWTGLVLYGDSTDTMVRADSITVSGTVQEDFGMTELTYLSDVHVISTGHTIPNPIALTTGQVCDEQYEGVLVSVTNAIVLTKNEHSYEIDDGSGSCYMGTRGDFTEPNVGDTVDVQGPLFYNENEWRIQPRDNNDITINGVGSF